jgi:hypothetical protein
MKIPIYIGLDGTPTFRAYTLLNETGQWHKHKGITGPARIYEADDAVLPAPGRSTGVGSTPELVLVLPDRSVKTAADCWADSVEI